MLLISSPCFAQATTGQASNNGPCSVANTGTDNKIEINCGIGKEQGRKVLAILNKILSDHLDEKAVMAKLDELIQSNAASGILLSPSFSGPLKFEIGDSGAIFDLEPNMPLKLPFAGESPALTVERVANHIEVSTGLRDASGKLVAEIVRNEWKVRPSLLWDRNYNENSLEVLGETGEVVLQISLMPDRIRIQGIWWSKSGNCTEMVKDPSQPGFVILMPDVGKCGKGSGLIKINPIFMYPSDRHLGELRKP